MTSLKCNDANYHVDITSSDIKLYSWEYCEEANGEEEQDTKLAEGSASVDGNGF